MEHSPVISATCHVCPWIVPFHEEYMAAVRGPLRLRHKRHCRFCLLSQGSVTLEEAGCHVLRTLKRPFGEMHVVRNWVLQPTALWRAPSGHHILLQMTAARLTSSLPLQETPSQKHQLSCPLIPDALKRWANKYFLFFTFIFVFLDKTSMAYGGSQARGRIRAVAAGLCYSHSNARSEPHLWPTLQLMETSDP